MIKAFGIIFAVMLISMTGQMLIKYGFSLNSDYQGATFSLEGIMKIITNPYLVAGILIVGMNFFLWLAVLRIFELSYAYSMASFEYVLVLILSHFLLKEAVNIPKIAGVLLIVAGIIFLNIGEAKVLKKDFSDGVPPLFVDDK